MVNCGDCGLCRADVVKGVACHRCNNCFCNKCVDLPNILPKSFSNAGIFYFCTICRVDILKNQVAPIGDSVGKKGGVVIVNNVGIIIIIKLHLYSAFGRCLPLAYTSTKRLGNNKRNINFSQQCEKVSPK